MDADQLAAMAADPRLSPDAFRVIVYVAGLGVPGETQIVKSEDLSIILQGGEKPIRSAVRRAEHCGYLKVDCGGRAGHKLTYTPSGKSLPQGRRSALNPSPRGGIPPLVVEEGEVVNPLSPPDDHPLSVRAMQAISDAAEKLAGCRGSLVDYLHARVPEPRQYGYVQSVVSWLDNPAQAFRGSSGGVIPAEERVKILAVALNEMAASDESKYAAPVGDVRNVKNKVSALAKSHDRKATGTYGARASPRDQPSDTQVYTPTETFRGFNG